MNYTSKTEPSMDQNQIPRKPVNNKSRMAYTSNDWRINQKKRLKTLESTRYLTTYSSDSSMKTEAKDEIL